MSETSQSRKGHYQKYENYKRKNLTGKGKHRVEEVGQPLTEGSFQGYKPSSGGKKNKAQINV